MNHMKRHLAWVVVVMLVATFAGQALAKEEVHFVAAQYHTDADTPYWAAVERAFEAAHPDIDLQVEIIDWNVLFAKLTTMVGGGNPPDLANIANIWLPQYVADDVAYPINEFMTSEFEAQFIPSLLNPTTAEALGQGMPGNLYGLPIAVSARVMYYNKDIFARAGIKEVPATWPEVMEAARQIKAKVPGVFPFGIPMTTEEGEQYFAYFLWSFGGEFFDEAGNFTVNSPEGVAALQFMLDLHRAGLTNPAPSAIRRDDMQIVFTQGRIGMFLTGPWEIAIIAKENPNLNFGIAETPSLTRKITAAVTDSLIMFKESENKEAAWKFVEFMYQTPFRLEFDLAMGMLPESRAVVVPLREQAPQLGTFMDALPRGKFLPLHPKWEQITLELIKQLQLAFLGEKTAQQALNDAVRKVNTEILTR